MKYINLKVFKICVILVALLLSNCVCTKASAPDTTILKLMNEYLNSILLRYKSQVCNKKECDILSKKRNLSQTDDKIIYPNKKPLNFYIQGFKKQSITNKEFMLIDKSEIDELVKQKYVMNGFYTDDDWTNLDYSDFGGINESSKDLNDSEKIEMKKWKGSGNVGYDPIYPFNNLSLANFAQEDTITASSEMYIRPKEGEVLGWCSISLVIKDNKSGKFKVNAVSSQVAAMLKRINMDLDPKCKKLSKNGKCGKQNNNLHCSNSSKNQCSKYGRCQKENKARDVLDKIFNRNKFPFIKETNNEEFNYNPAVYGCC